LMYCSLFRNFTFCFYFILACLYIFVLLVFSFRCLFQCLFICLFISFVFPFSIYLLFMLCDYFIIFPLKVYLALKRDYHILFVYWLIAYVVFLKIIVIKDEALLTAIRFLVISHTPILIAKYLFTGSMKL
jgi:hypothetical protein